MAEYDWGIGDPELAEALAEWLVARHEVAEKLSGEQSTAAESIGARNAADALRDELVHTIAQRLRAPVGDPHAAAVGLVDELEGWLDEQAPISVERLAERAFRSIRPSIWTVADEARQRRSERIASAMSGAPAPRPDAEDANPVPWDVVDWREIFREIVEDASDHFPNLVDALDDMIDYNAPTVRALVHAYAHIRRSGASRSSQLGRNLLVLLAKLDGAEYPGDPSAEWHMRGLSRALFDQAPGRFLDQIADHCRPWDLPDPRAALELTRILERRAAKQPMDRTRWCEVDGGAQGGEEVDQPDQSCRCAVCHRWRSLTDVFIARRAAPNKTASKKRATETIDALIARLFTDRSLEEIGRSLGLVEADELDELGWTALVTMLDLDSDGLYWDLRHAAIEEAARAKGLAGETAARTWNQAVNNRDALRTRIIPYLRERLAMAPLSVDLDFEAPSSQEREAHEEEVW